MTRGRIAELHLCVHQCDQSIVPPASIMINIDLTTGHVTEESRSLCLYQRWATSSTRFLFLFFTYLIFLDAIEIFSWEGGSTIVRIIRFDFKIFFKVEDEVERDADYVAGDTKALMILMTMVMMMMGRMVIVYDTYFS